MGFHRSAAPSLFTLLLGAFLVTGCASSMKNQAGASPENVENVEGEGDADFEAWQDNDPLEGFNRAMFKFNEGVDTVLLKPAAKAYRAVVPEAGREGVSNFLSNLTSPVVFANAVLQGDPKHAFTTLWRFILNSTLGVAGIFDFADANTDLKERQEDFGQTLGVYGAGSGPYIVLPLIGPSSGRDFLGRVVDWVIDPVNYLEDEVVYTRLGLTAIDSREKNLDVIDEIYRTSLDPYATIRSAYLQKRESDVKNNTRNAVRNNAGNPARN